MLVGVFVGFGTVTREANGPAGAIADSLDGTVEIIGLTLEPVAGIEPGESFQPVSVLDQANPDVLVLPGGFGCRPLSRDPGVVDSIRRIAETCRGVLAISTGTLLLAATGLLADQVVAGHWLTADELEPYGVTLSDEPIRTHGTLFTTSGIVAATDAVPVFTGMIRYRP